MLKGYLKYLSKIKSTQTVHIIKYEDCLFKMILIAFKNFIPDFHIEFSINIFLLTFSLRLESVIQFQRKVRKLKFFSSHISFIS